MIQDSQGALVVAGWAFGTVSNAFADMANAPPLFYNPTAASTEALSCGEATTSERKMMLMKLDLEGDIDWNHFYSNNDDPVAALTELSYGWSVVETDRNGVKGYRIVGTQRELVNVDGVAELRVRPFIVQTSVAGIMEWKKRWAEELGYWQDSDPNMAALAIVRKQDPGTGAQHFLITGNRGLASGSSPYLAYFVEPNSSTGFVPPTWVVDGAVNSSQFPELIAGRNHTPTDACFVQRNGETAVVWPLIANQTGGNKFAEGRVYAIQVDDPATTVASVDLGELHAFDLYMGITPMSNGNVAVVTTKWPEGFSVNGDPYGWNDMPQDVRDCLERYTSYDGEGAAPVINWTIANPGGPGLVYRFYGTQSYAAELDVDDLSIVWDHQWIHDGGYEDLTGYDEPTDCYQGNPRRRQCNFKVVQASDGGLLVCGNTGHNFDDAYIAKLMPCELLFPTADLELDENGQFVLAGSTTWTTDRNVIGTVVVPDGVTLTIDGATIGFAVSTPEQITNITVLSGGTLQLLNGAHLTTWQGCPAPNPGLWDGVKVFGHYGESTFDQGQEILLPQGLVIMRDEATISNAKVGILAGNAPLANPEQQNNQWAGWLDLKDAIFRNNRYGVVAHRAGPIGFLPQRGDKLFNGPGTRFENCTFETTADLLDAGSYPVAHVALSRRKDAVFLGCTFANDRTDIPSLTSLQLGHGIKAFNSYYTVRQSSVFRNLDHGIRATSTHSNLISDVRDSQFQNNVCGIYISGEAGLTIRNNTFALGKWWGIPLTNPDEEFWGDNHRGIFTTSSTGLNIRDNSLTRSTESPAEPLLEGIVVGYTRGSNEVVYGNSAAGLSIGYVGEGISADVDGDAEAANTIGLQFQCNSNSINEKNVISRKADPAPAAEQERHTIRGFQGLADRAAGNSFDQNTDADLEKNTTFIPVISYFFDPAFPDQEPSNFLPTDFAVQSITGTSNACAVGPGGFTGNGLTIPGTKALVQQNRTDYGSLRYVYEQLIDGGNTNEVVQEIIGTWPNDVWELRSQLLSRSPYLSTTALKELVNKALVPVAIKLEVCVANPEATQQVGFLEWAKAEALYPLPTYALDAIVASWETRTYRTYLELELAGKHTALTQGVHQLLELYRADSIHADPDSLRGAWKQLRTRGARYAEVGLLLKDQRYSEALSVLNAMPVEKELRPREEDERQRMLSYVELLTTAHGAGRSEDQLTAAEVSTLASLVGDHYDRPAVWASNLLCAQYGQCRSPYTGGKAAVKSRTAQHPTVEVAEAATGLQIHPNPASAWTAFTYKMPGNGATLHLRVRDSQGRVLFFTPAAGEEGQVVWDCRGVAPGVYTVELLREGKLERSERLIIQP
ncbi:MAG: right-handed parallel beta-helix repeat-containing protein [Flavobacteriales bacterium]|nr:right-handed parallel beta-helix repeat-containing protein [Flavobacteriales bacterium]